MRSLVAKPLLRARLFGCERADLVTRARICENLDISLASNYNMHAHAIFSEKMAYSVVPLDFVCPQMPRLLGERSEACRATPKQT